jgi:hypothetical protein
MNTDTDNNANRNMERDTDIARDTDTRSDTYTDRYWNGRGEGDDVVGN